MKNKADYILKMSFVAIGIIGVFAIIFVSWVWNLVFNPQAFNVSKWAERVIFNISIALLMMVLGFIAIAESLKSKENGKYNLIKDEFQNDVKTLYADELKLNNFDDWLPFHAERQLRNKKIKFLTSKGMKRTIAMVIVDYASTEDIKVITGLEPNSKPKGVCGENVIKYVDDKKITIPAVKDTFAYYIEQVLSGMITIEVGSASYYTSVDTKNTNIEESLEAPIHTDSERIKSTRRSFIAKALSMAVYITLFALLATDVGSDMNTEEALWQFTGRMLSATGGFISGGMAGATNIMFLIKAIKQKRKVLAEYNASWNTGEFSVAIKNENEFIEIIPNKQVAISKNQ